MIDTEALRKKVIDLAIQGKLTEQLPSDGDAKTLYAQIMDRKSQLIKEGKIKKDKALPDIAADEIPFEIPDNWKWCRLGEMYSVLMGQSPDGMNVGKDIDGMEFHQGKIYFGDKFLKESEQKSSELTRVADENSVLLCVRAPVGVVNITERKICIGRGLCALKALADMEPYYLFYYLLSCRKSFENSGTGSTFSSITVDVVKKHLIPIPPLAEQKRIVEVLDSVFNQFEVIDNLQAKYSNDLAVLKSKIIDAGIQGKLTEQLPDDGDAEDLFAQILNQKSQLIKEGKIKKGKSLPEITADEIPFEIPKNWKWVRIGQIFTLQAGKNKVSADIHGEQTDECTYPCYGGNGLRGYVSEFNVSGKHALIGRQGALCGNINLADGNFWATEHAVVVYQYANTDVDCFALMLKALNLNQYATSVAQPGLAVGNIEKVLIPLPPLAEQKRITKKIADLLEAIA